MMDRTCEFAEVGGFCQIRADCAQLEDENSTLKAEVDRLTALNAHAVVELNRAEADLEAKRQDYRTLRAEAVYLRVALREAMAYLPGAIGTSDMGRCQKCGAMTTSGSIRYCKKCIWEVAKGALSTNAGKDLLERVKLLESIVEAATAVAEIHVSGMVPMATLNNLAEIVKDYQFYTSIEEIEKAGDLLERLRKLEAVVSVVKLMLKRSDGLEQHFEELDGLLDALDGDSQ